MSKGWTEKQDSMGPQTPGRVKRLFGAQKKSGEEGSIPGSAELLFPDCSLLAPQYLFAPCTPSLGSSSVNRGGPYQGVVWGIR